MTANVLVVDDSRIQRVFMGGILNKLGVQADLAEGMEDALRISYEKRYDIIFMDNVMPGSGGRDTIRKIRSGYGNPNERTPAVLLCEEGAGTPPRGFQDILKKPVEYRLLYDELTKFLPKEKRDVLIDPSVSVNRNSDDGMGEDKKRSLSHTGASVSGSGGGNRGAVQESSITFDIVADDTSTSDTGTIPAWLNDAGLDVKQGIKYCGSEEGYLAALDIFYKTIEQKANEIQGYYREKDIESYTIKVHALKSSARIVGATALSELAKELEQAGKDGNEELINKKTDGLLEDYRRYTDNLAPLFRKADVIDGETGGSGKPAPPDGTMKDAYTSMLEFSNQMDYSLVDMVLKSLEEYELPEKDKEIVKEIQSKLMQLDWDGIKETLTEIDT